MRRLIAVLIATFGLAAPASDAEAFCGFYIAGADSKVYNNATVVALMRDGTKTVLSMQNDYQGPPKDFAMVVPVPVVLQKENVKTLPRTIFERLDKLAAPRLVEYWEQDPCQVRKYRRKSMRVRASGGVGSKAPVADKPAEPKVKIEAQFKVGEYEIVILSATEALALENWITGNGYKIPAGAAKHLDPYVQNGWKFFVAKVNPKKVTFKGNRAVLSPLRFHYDSEQFSLPIRLGLINSKGEQDLIVHIIAKNQRYEVANYDNVAIPTNLLVKNRVRKRFGAFYESILADTWKKHPGAVITEYSWMAMSCDPCPEQPLTASELATLGLDVIEGTPAAQIARPPGKGKPVVRRRPPRRPMPRGWVLTRMHARYTAKTLGDDLIFRKAPAITGGRGGAEPSDAQRVAQSSRVNTFQGRYIIRHKWTGPVKCKNPVRGVWGGPPRGKKQQITAAGGSAFVAKRRKVNARRMVRGKIPKLSVAKGEELPAPKPTPVKQPDPPDEGTGDGTDAAAERDAGATEVADNTGTETPTDTVVPEPVTPDPPPEQHRADRGCGCGTGSGSAPGALLLIAVVAFAIRPRNF